MRAALATAALALAACHGARPAAPAAKTDRIIFSHKFHADLEIGCAECHDGVADAPDLSKSYLPREATCLTCHQEHKDSNDCAFCHADPKRPETYAARPRDIEIPHAVHTRGGQAPAVCARCHPVLPETEGPPPVRPGHSTCFGGCHVHQEHYAQARCEPCHVNLWRFPIRPVATFSHQGNFAREHGPQALTAAAACARCHDQTYCAECHAAGRVAGTIERLYPDQVERRWIHPGTYVAAHEADARAEPASCQRCHATRFCDSCHALQGVSSSAASPRDPHPPGWAVPGSPEFHGDAARRDILSCAACHDQGAASVCVTCHRVGGVGGNPHPASFLKRHDLDEAKREGMCLACH